MKPISPQAAAALSEQQAPVSVKGPEGPPIVRDYGDRVITPHPSENFRGELQRVAGGPMSVLRNLFEPARRALGDEAGVRTVQELIPDSTLDEMYDAVTDPQGPRNPFHAGGFNLDYIDAEDDVLSAIDRVAQLNERVARARGRHVVTNEETRALAQSLADDLGDEGIMKLVLERAEGGTFNAHQMLASRHLYNRVMEDVVTHAEAVIANGGVQDIARFRHRMALASAMHAQLKGAQMEAARTLQAFQIPSVGGPAPRASEQAAPEQAGVTPQPAPPGLDTEAARDLLERGGGTEAAVTAAEAVLAAARDGSLGALSRTARKVQGKDLVDAVLEGYLGAMLSSTDTWGLALAGNAMITMTRNAEHWVGGMAGLAMRGDLASGLDPFMFTYGQLQGLVSGTLLAGKTLLRGEAGMATKFTDGTHQPAIAAETFRNARIPGFNKYTLGDAWSGAAAGAGRLPAGRLMEPAMLMGSGALGRVTDFAGEYIFRLPFRVLAAEDQLFRSISYMGELQAGATRFALENASDQVSARELYRRALDDPENTIPGVHMKSLSQARADVLQSPGSNDLFSSFQRSINHPVGRIALKPVFPFMRVINNSLMWSWDRLPLLPHVADAVRAPGPENRWNRLLENTPERDQEIAKLVTGATLLAAGWQMNIAGAFNGTVGEMDRKVREGARLMGLQGTSVVFDVQGQGTVQYDINRMDPQAMLFLIGAMSNEAIALADSDEEGNSIALAATLAIRDVLSDKAALGGLNDLMQIWAAPEGSFDDKLFRFLSLRASAGVPAILGKLARSEQPYYKDAGASNPYDTPHLRLLSELHNRTINRLPSRAAAELGIDSHETLPDHVNLFGEPWKRPAGWPSEWTSFVATSKPRFSREQLAAALPAHLQGRISLRGLRVGNDLSREEHARLLLTVGPHGELERLGMPVSKRQRRWKGVELPRTMHTYLSRLEGPRLFMELSQLMRSRLYNQSPDEADVDGSKAELIQAATRRVRDQVDRELMTDPNWQMIADARRLRESTALEGFAPLDPSVPGVVPGTPITPKDAVQKALEGQF